jgi:hypothetical protein
MEETDRLVPVIGDSNKRKRRGQVLCCLGNLVMFGAYGACRANDQRTQTMKPADFDHIISKERV